MRLLAFFVFTVLCSCITGQTNGGSLKFTIDKTWEGKSVIPTQPVTLMLSSTKDGDVKMDITAPYFGDPVPDGKPGLPFMRLWDFEVVEAFFLNDNQQYLEVEVGPHGHHLVLLLSGERNTIRHSLSLNVTTDIMRKAWSATAIIPKEYFPPQVNKFNAYTIHGVGDNRIYWSLYPTDGSTTSPDFHNLQFFQPIDMNVIHPDFSSSRLSSLWESAMNGIIRYNVSRQWNSGPVAVAPSDYSLQGFQGGVEMNYTIKENIKYPFEYTVFVFENTDEEALKITLYSNGEYLVNFLTNRNRKIGGESNAPIDYRVEAKVPLEDGQTLRKGSVMIPPEYFPPHVSLINIYALFGIEVKQVDALEPLMYENESSDPRPNLENLRHFTTIDFDNLVETNTEYSSFWRNLLNLHVVRNKIDDKFRSDVTTEAINETEEPLIVDADNSSNELLDARSNNFNIEMPITTEETVYITEEIPAETEIPLITSSEILTFTEAQVDIMKSKDSNVPNTPDVIKQDLPMTTESFYTEMVPVTEIADVSGQEGSAIASNDNSITEHKILDERTSVVEVPVTMINFVDYDTEDEQLATTLTPVIENIAEESEKVAVSKNENIIDKEETAQSIEVIKVEVTEEVIKETAALKSANIETKLEDQSAAAPTNKQILSKLQSDGAIQIPEGFMPENKQSHLHQPLALFAAPRRDTFIRKFEEKESDKNIVPITFKLLLNTEKKFEEDYPEEHFDPKFEEDYPEKHFDPKFEEDYPEKHFDPIFEEDYPEKHFDPTTDYSDMQYIDQPHFDLPEMTPDLEAALSDVFDILSQDQLADTDLELALDTLISINDRENITGEDLALDLPDYSLEDYVTDVFPPPHPFCFMEGLVRDPIRCQVFYECVIEDGYWQVYDWRCKRGYYYDEEKVACIQGYC